MDQDIALLLQRWERTVPPGEREDPIFALQAYRVARCLGDLAVADARRLATSSDRRMLDQLCRAAVSVAANIAEGYGRRGLADRAKFYGYALGSLRETRTWYSAQAHLLPDVLRLRRDGLISLSGKLLNGLIKSVQERGRMPFKSRVREE